MTAERKVIRDLANVDLSAKQQVTSSLAACFRCSSAVFWGFDPNTGQPRGEMISTHAPETVELYAAHYYRLDPFRDPMLGRDLGTPVVGSTVIADASLARSAFYNDFGSRIETFHLMSALMPVGGPQERHVAALSLHRPRDGEPFDAETAGWLRRLMPHVRRSNHPVGGDGACTNRVLKRNDRGRAGGASAASFAEQLARTGHTG